MTKVSFFFLKNNLVTLLYVFGKSSLRNTKPCLDFIVYVDVFWVEKNIVEIVFY